MIIVADDLFPDTENNKYITIKLNYNEIPNIKPTKFIELKKVFSSIFLKEFNKRRNWLVIIKLVYSSKKVRYRTSSLLYVFNKTKKGIEFLIKDINKIINNLSKKFNILTIDIIDIDSFEILNTNLNAIKEKIKKFSDKEIFKNKYISFIELFVRLKEKLQEDDDFFFCNYFIPSAFDFEHVSHNKSIFHIDFSNKKYKKKLTLFSLIHNEFYKWIEVISSSFSLPYIFIDIDKIKKCNINDIYYYRIFDYVFKEGNKFFKDEIMDTLNAYIKDKYGSNELNKLVVTKTIIYDDIKNTELSIPNFSINSIKKSLIIEKLYYNIGIKPLPITFKTLVDIYCNFDYNISSSLLLKIIKNRKKIDTENFDNEIKKFIVNSFYHIFKYSIKKNKLKEILKYNIDKNGIKSIITKINNIYKYIGKFSKFISHLISIYKTKNITIDLFKINNENNYFYFFDLVNNIVSHPELEHILSIIRTYKNELRYVLPVLLKIHYLELNKLVEILSTLNKNEIKLFLKPFVKCSNDFSFIIKTNNIHDLLYFISDIETFKKVLFLYSQLSPKDENFNEILSSFNELYKLLLSNKQIYDEILQIKNVNKIPKTLPYLKNIVNKEIRDKVSHFINNFKDNDNELYNNIFINELITTYKLKPRNIKFIEKINEIVKEKQFFIDKDYNININGRNLRVLFRNYNSVLSIIAPKEVDCCASVEYDKFWGYLINKYTYNLIVEEPDKNRIILWSLLVIAKHKVNKKLFLTLDNVECYNDSKLRIKLTENFDIISKIIFDYITKLNKINDKISTEKFLIGKNYNDIFFDDIPYCKTVPNKYEEIDKLPYTDAFGNNEIYEINKKDLTNN